MLTTFTYVMGVKIWPIRLLSVLESFFTTMRNLSDGADQDLPSRPSACHGQ